MSLIVASRFFSSRRWVNFQVGGLEGLLGFRVEGLGLRVEGLGLRVGKGLRVWGFGV